MKAKDTKQTSSFIIKDNRTGMQYEVPIYNNQFVFSKDVEQIKDKNGTVMRLYDPGYMNTMSCTSSICYIDGAKGIL